MLTHLQSIKFVNALCNQTQLVSHSLLHSSSIGQSALLEHVKALEDQLKDTQQSMQEFQRHIQDLEASADPWLSGSAAVADLEIHPHYETQTIVATLVYDEGAYHCTRMIRSIARYCTCALLHGPRFLPQAGMCCTKYGQDLDQDICLKYLPL